MFLCALLLLGASLLFYVSLFPNVLLLVMLCYSSMIRYSLAQVPFCPLLLSCIYAQIDIPPPSPHFFLHCVRDLTFSFGVWEIQHLMLEFGRKIRTINLQASGSNRFFLFFLFFLEFFLVFFPNFISRFFFLKSLFYFLFSKKN
jgi:hypothetical protein